MHSNLIEQFSFVEDSMLHISEFAMHHHGFIDLTVVVELTLTPRVKLVQLCMCNCVTHKTNIKISFCYAYQNMIFPTHDYQRIGQNFC